MEDAPTDLGVLEGFKKKFYGTLKAYENVLNNYDIKRCVKILQDSPWPQLIHQFGCIMDTLVWYSYREYPIHGYNIHQTILSRETIIEYSLAR